MPTRIAAPLIVTLLFSCVVVDGDGAENGLVFDGDQAKAHVTHLSADAMQGRMTCTEGYRKAADWVAAQFKQWGLKPAGEEGTYFQEVSIPGFDWNTGVPTLKVGEREFPFDDRDYAVDAPSTPGTTLHGEVVFAGYGIAAAAKGLDEYDGVDVQGKIVLVLKGSPKDAPRLRSMLQAQSEDAEAKKGEQKEEEQAEQWTEESKDLAKIKTAYEKGAVAVLLYDPEESPESDRRRGRSSRRSGQSSFKPERDFLCFTIHERVFRAIMRQDPRQSPRGLKRSLDGMRRAIQQKKVQSRKTGIQARLTGYQVSIRYDEEHGNNVARNVLAKIEGTDPKLKNEYVLIGAHLDHVGVRDGYVYNGADDNASGSAVVLEVARVLAQDRFQPKRTLIFCCWCGEERGLLGSRHYTNEPCDGVTIDQVVANLNIDMVGMGEDLGATGALNFPTIWDVIQRDQDPKTLDHVKPSESGPVGSDNAEFLKRGIEAILLISRGGDGHPDYHQPEDDAEKIDPEMLRLAGQFVLQGTVNLANETKVKLLIDKRQQLYRAMRMEISNLNPDLPGSRWSRVDIKEKSSEALYDDIHERARALLKGASSSGDSSGEAKTSKPNPRPKKSLARGLTDLKPIGADTRLLELVVDFHGVGRVDLEGDDGVWVVGGRLTDDGEEALKCLEKNDVVVRLVSPGEALIKDTLSAASKPFIITGDYEITHAMATRLNDKGVLLGMDFDPRKVGDFIARLEKAKNLLGERGNLFAFLTATERLDEAKRPLYLGLIARGWTHNEICGSRKQRGLVGGGNLSPSGGQSERST